MRALSGHAFPDRGDAAGRPNKVGSGRVGPIGGIATAVLVVAVVALDAGWEAALTTSMIAGIIGMSVLVVTGYAGKVFLAPYAFAGLGAFVNRQRVVHVESGYVFVDHGVPQCNKKKQIQ